MGKLSDRLKKAAEQETEARVPLRQKNENFDFLVKWLGKMDNTLVSLSEIVGMAVGKALPPITITQLVYNPYEDVREKRGSLNLKRDEKAIEVRSTVQAPLPIWPDSVSGNPEPKITFICHRDGTISVELGDLYDSRTRRKEVKERLALDDALGELAEWFGRRMPERAESLSRLFDEMEQELSKPQPRKKRGPPPPATDV